MKIVLDIRIRDKIINIQHNKIEFSLVQLLIHIPVKHYPSKIKNAHHHEKLIK